MPVTIREIAKHCGVSIATVSRVINGSDAVTEATSAKINTAIKELGYVIPTPSVRTLQKTLRTIGLLMSDINNIHFPAVIRGLEEHLFNHDYSLFVCNTDEDPVIERRYIKTLIDKGVEGLVFLGTRLVSDSNDHIEEISKKVPVLLIDEHIVGANVFSVEVDETEGAFQAVEHLILNGHKKIAYIRGDGEYTTSIYKYEGFKKALDKYQIEEVPEYIFRADPHEHGGYLAGRALIDLPDRPTGYFAENDQLAMGLLRAAHENGLRIPEQASIIGFSDSPLAAELYPPLSSVNQFANRTGHIAAETILKVISGETLVQHRIIIQPALSVRESTGPVQATEPVLQLPEK